MKADNDGAVGREGAPDVKVRGDLALMTVDGADDQLRVIDDAARGQHPIVPLHIDQPTQLVAERLQLTTTEGHTGTRPHGIGKEQTGGVMQHEALHSGVEVRRFYAVADSDFDARHDDVGTIVHQPLHPLQIVVAAHGLVVVHQDDVLARGLFQTTIPVLDGSQGGLVPEIAQALVAETGHVVGNVGGCGVIRDDDLHRDTLLLQGRRNGSPKQLQTVERRDDDAEYGLIHRNCPFP